MDGPVSLVSQPCILIIEFIFFFCRTVSVSTPGSSGALNLGSTVQPGSTVRQAEDSSSDKALRYIEPPQQVLYYLLVFFNA